MTKHSTPIYPTAV